MNDFTASNGITIRYTVGIDGAARLIGTSPRQAEDAWTEATASPEGIEALREFFRAEEDERLGRWRSTIDAAWTAVLQADSGYVFFRHDDGERGFSVATDQSNMPSWTRELQEVAREYFDAHPEPKPWHEAKEGEVWVIENPDIDPIPTIFQAGAFRDHGGYWRTEDVTAARRIWPEVAS